MLDSEEIQRLLDDITAVHASDPGFISVDFLAEGHIVVRFLDVSRIRTSPPGRVAARTAAGDEVFIEVKVEPGTAIVPAIAGPETEPLIDTSAFVGEMGGDRCRHHSGSWG